MPNWMWCANKRTEYTGGGVLLVDWNNYGGIYNKNNFSWLALLRWSVLDMTDYVSGNMHLIIHHVEIEVGRRSKNGVEDQWVSHCIDSWSHRTSPKLWRNVLENIWRQNLCIQVVTLLFFSIFIFSLVITRAGALKTIHWLVGSM